MCHEWAELLRGRMPIPVRTGDSNGECERLRVHPLAALAVISLTVACGGSPAGPSGGAVTLSASKQSVSPNESVVLSATVRGVPDGTRVTLSASLGTVAPPDVQVRGGIATSVSTPNLAP